MHKKVSYLLIFLSVISFNSHSSEKILKDYLGVYYQLGTGKLSIFFIDIYDIKLFSKTKDYSKDKPFAIEINYLKDVKSTQIVDTSISEIKKIAKPSEDELENYRSILASLFPNIYSGDQLIGIKTANSDGVFFYNKKRIGKINDEKLVDSFFDIWLSEKTSHPELREKLLMSYE
jgi:hypothetical protein